MSQIYRVTLSETVSRVIHVSDEVRYPLDWVGLPEDGLTREILQAILETHGFTEESGQEGTKLRGKGPSGEVLLVDLDSMQVTARLEEERELGQTITETTQGVEERKQEVEQAARKHMREKVSEAQKKLARREAELQREITRRLEEGESTRREHLQKIVQEVYAESLKRRARSLGEVVEIQESTGEDGDYELTITVEF